jgi:hypothetical protein
VASATLLVAASGVSLFAHEAPAAPPDTVAAPLAGSLTVVDVVAPPAAAPPAAPAAPVPPALVAGLDRAEMDNAATIVRVGRERGLPQRAYVIALATALQESDLYNIASKAVPQSFDFPHQGASTDHDSIGLFQQRPSQGWGDVDELMDPAKSAGLFYDRLARVADWESLRLTEAAQAVQRSGFPGAYQKHESRAQQIVAALAA